MVSACCTGSVRDYYEHIEGKAEITVIEVSQYNPDGKSAFRDVFFRFIPKDPEAASKYKFKNFTDEKQRLFVNSRGNLLATWVEKQNIKIGNVYNAFRLEKKGRCGGAPVVFDVQIPVSDK
jgi:hypothetical protein